MSIDGNKKSEENKGKSTKEFPIQEYRLVPLEYDNRLDENDQIDVIELIKVVWERRKFIYKFIAAGVVVGVIAALIIPKEYSSSTTLMPEYSSDSQGSASSLLQQFGGLVGVSGGSYSANSNAIRVDLYPQIVQSLPFQIELLETEIYFERYDTTTTVYNYFAEVKSPGLLGNIQKYTIGLPGVILEAFSSSDSTTENFNSSTGTIISVSKKQLDVIKLMRSRVAVSLNEESGVVTISAKMPEARASAEVAQIVYNRLTEYLIEYRTEKVNVDLTFIEQQLDNARKRFNEAQLKRAEFEDSNQGTLSARANTDRERLQSEFDLAFNVYNTLAQRYEEAKLKVQEETPVFKILQPIQVPLNDDTSGVMVLAAFIALSVFCSISWIIGISLFRQLS